MSSINEGSDPDRVEKLLQLLVEASKAHSVYEKDVLHGVRDEEWPAWYTNYLAAHGIVDLAAWDSQGHEPQEGLALLLAQADRLHQRTGPKQPWPLFYVKHILGLDTGRSAGATEAESR